jgi:hypothetical protein
MIVVVIIGCETTATARGALTLIVRLLVDDTITIAVWTCFHVYLMRMPLAEHDASGGQLRGFLFHLSQSTAGRAPPQFCRQL